VPCRPTRALEAVSSDPHVRPRKLRLLLAYAAVFLAAIPGCWFFFWCKNLFPSALLHPTQWIVALLVTRIFLQVLLSLLVLVPPVVAALWIISKFLTPGELRLFQERWSDN
jgi:hypothetical protein